MTLLAGTSGFAYEEWQPAFYPPGLPRSRWLAHFSHRVPTVEINNTFYRMPNPEVLERWHAETTPGFRFTLKAPRRITHFSKLRGCEDSLELLFRTALRLHEKLAAVLFQLPPGLKKDLACLRDFLACLPAGSPATVEFRHASWFSDDVFAELAARNVALGWNDDLELHTPEVATGNFGYIRLRRGDYSAAELDGWVERLRAERWERALVYFKHEENAWSLAERFAQRAGHAAPTETVSAWA